MQNQLSVTFSGDMSPVNGYSDIFKSSQVDKYFSDVIKLISETDLHITNLETPVSENGFPISKAGPNLRADPLVINGLKQLKVTHACLANNHIMDFGEDAAFDTIQFLQQHGIIHAGLVESPLSNTLPVVLLERNGVKSPLHSAYAGCEEVV